VSFAASVGKFADEATARVERTRRGVVVALFSAIITDTPVSDEETSPGAIHGRLRGNWQTSVGSPLLGEIPLRSGAAAQAEVAAATAPAKGDDTIFLRNNLPYAARIEFDGWSHTKAPAGMMRLNVARFQRLTAEKVREGKL
jgi:hypothetical protein